MPRTGKGAQANRKDLVTPRPLPVQVAPSAEYGQRAAEMAAQGAVPMGPPGSSTAPAPVGGQPTGGAVAPGATPDLASLLASAPSLAGKNGPLNRPTERPDEPVTHGLGVGPGAGPEILSGAGALAASGQAQQGTIATLLQHLSSQPGASSAMLDLTSRAVGGAQ